MILLDGSSVLNWIGAIGGLCGIVSVFYVWKDRRESWAQRKKDELWATKLDEATSALCKICLRFIAGGYGFPVVFPDPNVRQRIESYLIDRQEGPLRAHAKQLNPEMLRLRVVQETIDLALDTIKKFKEARPDDAQRLGL